MSLHNILASEGLLRSEVRVASWSQVREIVDQVLESSEGEPFRQAFGRWQMWYENKGLDSFLSSRRRELYELFAPVRKALSQMGSTVRLYRGEHNTGKSKEHRKFLSWTEYRPEAEKFAGRGGVVRVYDAPVSKILAVLPHGKGMEFLLPDIPSAHETQEEVNLCGYIEIGPFLAKPNFGFLPGTEDKKRAIQRIQALGGTILHWKPRRDNDEDYWSGFDPEPDHGILLFQVKDSKWDHLLDLSPWPWSCD